MAASGTRRPGAAPMAMATSRACVRTASTRRTVSVVSGSSSARAVATSLSNAASFRGGAAAGGGGGRGGGGRALRDPVARRLVRGGAAGGGDQLVGGGVHAVGHQIRDLPVGVELQGEPRHRRKGLHHLRPRRARAQRD